MTTEFLCLHKKIARLRILPVKIRNIKGGFYWEVATGNI